MKRKSWMSGVLLLEVAALAALPVGFARAADEHDHAAHMAHEPAAPMTHDHSAHGAPAPTDPKQESVPVTLSAKALTDQDGRSLRLKRDVVGDRIVVVSFVYTSCTTVCPAVSSIFSQLQSQLGSRLDADVRLVSLTVDPARDTPAQLKNYSAKFDARPGWFWLTGPAPSVTDALKGFGAYTANFENHPVVIMIGDGKTGKWSRHYGLSDPKRLLARVDDYLAARNKTGNSKASVTVPARDKRS